MHLELGFHSIKLGEKAAALVRYPERQHLCFVKELGIRISISVPSIALPFLVELQWCKELKYVDT